MNNDNKPPSRPGFLSGLPTVVQNVVSSARQHASDMHQQFRAGPPELAAQVDVVQQSLQRTMDSGMKSASSHIDSAMQTATLKASQFGRDNFKMAPHPDDWFPTRMKKKVANLIVDKTADNVDTLARGATDFTSGVADKVVSSTVDRLHPKNLSPFIYDPDSVRKYGSQFGRQVMSLPRAYSDPTGFASEWIGKKYTTARNVVGLAGELEGGMTDKLAHGGRALVDLTQETVAPVIGTAAAGWGIYNALSSTRQNTRTAMDSLFPSERTYGKVARMQPFRFLVSTPMARVVGNPRLSALLLGYGALTGIGRSILDSHQLAQDDPVMSARLAAEHREMLDSTPMVNARASVQKTKISK
jgi:hypothetical protein